jgi:hypothetical protein
MTVTTFVTWWCQLIGITSEAAIQVAVGVVGAGFLLGAIYLVAGVVLGLLFSISQ